MTHVRLGAPDAEQLRVISQHFNQTVGNPGTIHVAPVPPGFTGPDGRMRYNGRLTAHDGVNGFWAQPTPVPAPAGSV
jgi:hypothetical protein